MRAFTVIPGQAGSAKLDEVPDPPASDGSVLVQTLRIGICGTDREILSGAYGWAPPGQTRLIIGHESLGRVLDTPPGSGFASGDLVVGIVRRPDPVPCESCAHGEWDMCKNNRYTERGIKERNGFCSERYRCEPDFLVKLDPSLHEVGVLLEPATILAKAWEQVDRIGTRSFWSPKRVLVTGAGPVGLMAALMGVQRGLEVHVLDRMTAGIKPELVTSLGAQFHSGRIRDAVSRPDVIMECTGAGQLVFDSIEAIGPGGIICLTGLSSGGRKIAWDLAAINKEMVLENEVVFGSVNAGKRHYHQAADCLRRADLHWLKRIITRSGALRDWKALFAHDSGDVKTVIDFSP